MSITRDDWLSALRDADDDRLPVDDDSLTVMEFSALIGVCTGTATARLALLVASGKAIRTRKKIRRSDGQVMTTTAYRLVKEAPDMKQDDLDVELEPGLDGADTSDSDDASDGAGEAVRASRKQAKRSVRRGSRTGSTSQQNPRTVQQGRGRKV